MPSLREVWIRVSRSAAVAVPADYHPALPIQDPQVTEDDRAHAHERGVFRPAVQLACSNCERALCPIDPGLGVLMDRFTAKGRPVRADGPTPQRSRPHVKIERYPYDRGEVYAITCGGTRCGWMWVVETGALRRAAREAQQAGRSTVMTAKVGRRLPR